MTTSSAYSIPEAHLHQYNDCCRYLLECKPTLRTTLYTINKCEYRRYCFGELSYTLRSLGGPKDVTWYINIKAWRYTKLQSVLKQYLNWIFSEKHKDWFVGMHFEQTEDQLIIHFTDKLNKYQLIFATFLFRRIEWAPITVLNWHMLKKIKAPLEELNLLILANIVKFSNFESSIDDSHFVLGSYRSLMYYNSKLNNVSEIFKEHASLTKAHNFTSKWLPVATKQQAILRMELEKSPALFSEMVKYDTISRDW